MSSTRQDPLVRMAHVVGDFGNPFYGEERQRDVWNEASAFGLQLVIWCTLAVGTVTVWVVGAPAVPYVGVAIVLLGVVCGLSVAYAQHLGVDLTSRDHVLRWRLVPYAALVAALTVGLVRAQEERLTASTLAGMVTGASVVLLLAYVATRRRRGRPPERRAGVEREGRRASSRGSTSSTVTSRPSSRDSEVTVASAMPHGTIRSYAVRSGSQFSAKPCMVTPRATRMPIAATLRAPSGVHTPLRPSTRSVGQAQLGAHVDEQPLERADVGDDVDGVGQPDQRVAGDLPRAVPGDLAAAVDVDDRGAVLRALPRVGALAGRVDRRVLEQQGDVLGARDDLGVHRLLQAPRVVVRHEPEPTDLHRVRVRRGGSPRPRWRRRGRPRPCAAPRR